MRKLITILLTILTVNSFSQNVGISTTSTFTPDERLHVDGNIKVGNVASDNANIYLANRLYDMDNSNYFIDPGASSRVNGFNMDQGSSTSNSIFFIDDDDTGIYQELPNSISFSTSGSERIRITNTGNLYMLNNDITGLEQLHFESGSIWIDGDPGSPGQVLKSDGSELYWDDISTNSVTTETIFENLSNGTLWSHPDGINVNITNSKFIRVESSSTDDWSVFINGMSTNTPDNLLTISENLSNGESIELDISVVPCIGTGLEVWINEIHYDNNGGDVGEGVEIAGVSGTDLSGWIVYLYNGSNGQTYTPTTTLSGIIADQSNGIGTLWFPISGLQNGAPDGIVLYDGTNVVQFLSYEGTFTATNGVANGMSSTDIGVSEGSSTPIDQSLQLIGSGSSYSDFTWSGPSTSSNGGINDGQTIVASTPCSENGGFDINAGNNTTGEGFTIHISFTGDKYIGIVNYW